MCELLDCPVKTNSNSRAIQEKQWRTALKFKKNSKGQYTGVKLLEPAVHLEKIFNTITENELLYLFLLIFNTHYIMNDKKISTLYISNSKLAQITGLVNLSYAYYLPSLTNKKYLEYAKDLESDILNADLHHYPKLVKAQKMIKNNNRNQLIRHLLENGVELQNLGKDKEKVAQKAIDTINDFIGPKNDFMPNELTLAAMKDFLSHVSASLNYKITSSLNLMENLGLINYEKVLLGFKKEDNKILIYQLTSEEKDKYITLRNETARTEGFGSYQSVVVYKMY